mmetsp:Transcript_24040/g.83087  ORF Transcript_24040/g.83087 Transcript_24040/m.83087 type:complete len:306 (+) Transcript_24040:909-1826(+)
MVQRRDARDDDLERRAVVVARLQQPRRGALDVGVGEVPLIKGRREKRSQVRFAPHDGRQVELEAAVKRQDVRLGRRRLPRELEPHVPAEGVRRRVAQRVSEEAHEASEAREGDARRFPAHGVGRDASVTQCGVDGVARAAEQSNAEERARVRRVEVRRWLGPRPRHARGHARPRLPEELARQRHHGPARARQTAAAAGAVADAVGVGRDDTTAAAQQAQRRREHDGRWPQDAQRVAALRCGQAGHEFAESAPRSVHHNDAAPCRAAQQCPRGSKRAGGAPREAVRARHTALSESIKGKLEIVLYV